MPSDRKVVAFRPSETETAILEFITEKYGVSNARAIGLAIRRMAEQDGYNPKPSEKSAKEDK